MKIRLVHCFLILTALAGLFAFIALMMRMPAYLARMEGAHAAVRDWEKGMASLEEPDSLGLTTYSDVQIFHFFDYETGLQWRTKDYFVSELKEDAQFRVGYNRQIMKLLKAGPPVWSATPFAVDDAELCEALDSQSGQIVSQFPHRISDGISIDRDPANSLPGVVWLKTTDSTTGMPESGIRVSLSRNSGEVYFVGGDQRIFAIHESGRILAIAVRVSRPQERVSPIRRESAQDAPPSSL